MTCWRDATSTACSCKQTHSAHAPSVSSMGARHPRGGEGGGHKFIIKLRPSSSLAMALAFRPRAAAAAAFALPLALANAGATAGAPEAAAAGAEGGGGGALAVPVTAEGVTPRVVLSKGAVDFGACVVGRGGSGGRPSPYASEVYVRNNTDAEVQVRARVFAFSWHAPLRSAACYTAAPHSQRAPRAHTAAAGCLWRRQQRAGARLPRRVCAGAARALRAGARRGRRRGAALLAARREVRARAGARTRCLPCGTPFWLQPADPAADAPLPLPCAPQAVRGHHPSDHRRRAGGRCARRAAAGAGRLGHRPLPAANL